MSITVNALNGVSNARIRFSFGPTRKVGKTTTTSFGPTISNFVVTGILNAEGQTADVVNRRELVVEAANITETTTAAHSVTLHVPCGIGADAACDAESVANFPRVN